MTDTIEVYRGDGSRRGPDIVEPLLSDAALLERGRAEMDKNAGQFNDQTIEVVFDQTARLGELVGIPDPTSLTLGMGKVTSISMKATLSDITMTIGVKKPI